MSGDELNEDWLQTLKEIDLNVLEFAQDNESLNLRLKTLEKSYHELEEESTTKETEWITGENDLRGKLRRIEEEKLQLTVEYEEKFKGLYEEIRRYSAHCMVLQKEAEIAKDELRNKIFELLQLEKFQEKNEEHDVKMDARYEVEKIRVFLENLKKDTSMVKQRISDMDVISLIEENIKRQKQADFCQERNQMLLVQIENLNKEKNMLSENESECEEGPSEKDLVIVQLQQEVKEMTKELSEVNQEKHFLERQLGYLV